MKRVVVLAVLACLTGCSNAPVAGLLDACFPSKPPGPRPPDRPRDPPADRPPLPDPGALIGPPAPGRN